MKLEQATPAQLTVFSLRAGRHLVLAPPGSGKTDLLALRLSDALDRRVVPESMLCVTFTNRAARNMVSRAGDLKGIRPFIGTLHKFGYQFLLSNQLIPANTVLMDEEDAEKMLEDASQSVTGGLRSPNPVDLTKTANYIRASEKIRLKLPFVENDLAQDPFLDRVCDNYRAIKESSCAIDFDDVLHLTLHHLLYGTPTKNIDFRWIQIDEVQDLSDLQWHIVQRLMAKDAHVVYFGDYDQAIYSFMGASHAALATFTKGATVHHLEDNFRSSPSLIEFFNAYAAANLPSRKEFVLRPGRKDASTNGTFKVVNVSGTFESEAQEIADTIVPFLAKSQPRIAVLTRTNKEAETVSQKLDSRKISHYRVSGFDLFRRRAIKDAMAFLRVMLFPMDRLSWTRLFVIFGGVDSLRAARQLVNEMFDAGLNPVDLLSNDGVLGVADDFISAAKKGRCIIFDTETTGLKPDKDDIIQIAAMELMDGVPTGKELEVFLNTERSLDETTKIHHIDAQYLATHGIPAMQGLSRFIEFAGDALLVGHNITFDLEMLKGNLTRLGIKWSPSNGSVDTMQVARLIHPRLPNYKVATLLRELQIEGKNSHNALDDVRATCGLFLRLLTDSVSGRAKRAEISEAYQKYLSKFAKSLSPFWIQIFERPDDPRSLSDIIQQFLDFAVLQANYKVSPDEMKYVTALNSFLLSETKSLPLKPLLRQWVPELSTYSEVDLITDVEKVVVSTVHKAKGLEFEAVVVTSCVKDIYPHYYSKTAAAREEDARLLYVALTRAKEFVVITTHDSTVNRGGKFPRYPSPFLDFMHSGGVSATNVVVVSPTTVTAVTPAGLVGAATVVVSGSKGTGTAVGGFTYANVVTPSWATLIEVSPDPAVVTDVTLRNAIIATGLPWRVKDTGTNIEMLLVPAGSFTMGCTPSLQYACSSDENPTHAVTLTNAFYLGRYEVTQAEWTAKMGSNPSQFQGAGYPDAVTQPVERISWNMITPFNTATGLRLPTEAEWEYAYRAQMGTTVTRWAFHNGTNDDALLGNIAWYSSNSGSQTHAVGGKAANALGLHDMSGNVWEWVNDWYGDYSSSPSTNPTGPSSGTYRVARGDAWYGGSLGRGSSNCRASGRDGNSPVYAVNAVGFRSARTP